MIDVADEFTHLTDSGVHMVEVGNKPDQKRRAIASGSIFLDKNTINMIQNEQGNFYNYTNDHNNNIENIKLAANNMYAEEGYKNALNLDTYKTTLNTSA